MGGNGTPLPYDTATDTEGHSDHGQGPGLASGPGLGSRVNVEPPLSTAEILRQRKLKKQRLRLAAEKFNEKPLKADWIHFALSLGLLQVRVCWGDGGGVCGGGGDGWMDFGLFLSCQ